MADPAKLAEIRKELKSVIKPEIARLLGEYQKLKPLMDKVAKSIQKADQFPDHEDVELAQAGFRALEKRMSPVIDAATKQLARLDVLAKDEEFVDEIDAFAAATTELRKVSGLLRGWLVRRRDELAALEKKGTMPRVRGDVAQKWAQAEAQVEKARKSADDAHAAMKKLYDDSDKVVRAGNLARLMMLQSAATAIDIAAAQVAIAVPVKLLAEVQVALNKQSLGDAADQYARDAKKLGATLDAARAKITEAQGWKKEIDEKVARAKAIAATLDKALKIPADAAKLVSKTLFNDPDKIQKVLQDVAKDIGGQQDHKSMFDALKKLLQKI